MLKCLHFILFYSIFLINVKIEVVKDIIKNCSFETKNQDDIIIRQGDIGDW
jgi:hypothetical protein